MSAAVLVVTPPPRHWANALMCSLALTVGVWLAREVIMAAVLATVQLSAPEFCGASLAVFTLPAWLVWRWYDDLLRTAPSR
jgi:hypothetical protein